MRRLLSFSLAVGLTLAAAPALANPIGFSVQGFGDDQLYTIDLATGLQTPIGATGVGLVLALSFQPGTGTLFGIEGDTGTLVTISTATGLATDVGWLGLGATFGAGLAFDNAGNLWMANEADEIFYSVNPISGLATPVGPMGQSVAGLAFFGGIVYGLADTPDHNLVSMNTLSGLATTIGPLNPSDFITYGGMDFDPSGTLWAIFGNSGGLNTTATIDILTGNSTPMAGLVPGFTSLAIIPGPGVLGLLVVAGAAVRRRRRR